MAKILISLSDDLLERIDREAETQGVNRSRFMREAALRQLGWPDESVLAEALQRGRDALADVGSFESAALVAAGRRAHDASDRRR